MLPLGLPIDGFFPFSRVFLAVVTSRRAHSKLAASQFSCWIAGFLAFIFLGQSGNEIPGLLLSGLVVCRAGDMARNLRPVRLVLTFISSEGSLDGSLKAIEVD